MALPPQGDPRRPLHLAIRLMRLLGGIFVLVGTCATVPFFIRGGGRAGVGVSAWFLIVNVAFYLVPGAALFVLSTHLARRRIWAVVASIRLASMMGFVILAGIAVMLVLAVAERADWVMIVPIALMTLMLVAVGQLIYFLARSFAAIRSPAPEERGFEPIMALPVPPPAAAAMYPQQEPRDARHEQPPADR